MDIKTNNHARDLVAWEMLPYSEQETFDYVPYDDRYSPRFVHYLGSWYDTGDFVSTHSDTWADHHQLREQGWHGYITESHFNAVFMRWADDNFESVIMGNAHW